MRTFRDATDLTAAAGTVLGTSDWLTIEQSRVDQFADATGDHQWIHVDVERAQAGPFGGTIAHGYLTLSLLPQFAWSIYSVENVAAAINYGLNRVRFVHPVPVGSRLRSTVALDSVTEVRGAVQLEMTHTVEAEIDGEPKTACVAQTISRVTFVS
jgi:acyl dehydratase